MATVDRALWRDIMDHLRKRHPAICRQWFGELEPVAFESGLLSVRTSTGVQQNYLQKRCVDQFTEAAQASTGALVAVRFIADEHVDSNEPVPAHAEPASGGTSGAAFGGGGVATASPARPLTPVVTAIRPPSPLRVIKRGAITRTEETDGIFDQTLISPDYSFNTFVTGPNNHLAYAAAVAVANQPGVAYNPLFIHGGVGLGKTHLLQAICQTLLQANPTLQICYLSCDAFMNQFLECVQQGKMNEFRHRYRHVDVLVIDDIHFLANRERTQEEFFHTFNELHQSNKQIVLSSDSKPNEIPQLEERLVSRFQCGMVVSISRPDYETRLAIIRSKLRIRGMEMPEDVASYIAMRIDTNARELEGALNTIQGHAALQNQPIDLAMAKRALGDQSRGGETAQVTLQQIIDSVTSFYEVKLSDLQSKRRHKSVAQPRQVCMWLARRRTHFSLEEIGAYFGGRDHTTVMHSIRAVDDRMSLDAIFAQQVARIAEQIGRAPVAAATPVGSP